MKKLKLSMADLDDVVVKLNKIVDWINDYEDDEIEVLLRESVKLGDKERF